MGVVVPSEEEFQKAKGVDTSIPAISSPAEGVIVLNPPIVVDEQTGQFEDLPEKPAPEVDVQVITGIQSSFTDNNRKKKDRQGTSSSSK